MIPEVGDIWEFHNEYLRLHESPILLLKRTQFDDYLGSITFLGLQLETGIRFEVLFNKSNTDYWSKVA